MLQSPTRHEQIQLFFDNDAAIKQFHINIMAGITDPERWRNGLHPQELHCLAAAIQRSKRLDVANLINHFLQENIALREKLKEYEHRPPTTTAQG